VNARTVLSRAIARLRKVRGWTQADLAEQTGSSLQFIAALEQDAKNPSLDTVDKLCAAFGITVSALFVEGEPPRDPKPRSKKEALERAIEAVPDERVEDVLEVVHVVSRMLARPRPSAPARGVGGAKPPSAKR
jgi:transcriptional regulator with XRE-family HTH domain